LHDHLVGRLLLRHPSRQIEHFRALVVQLDKEITHRFLNRLSLLRHPLHQALGKLEMLNPLAVLTRGYSITYGLKDGRIVRRSGDVKADDAVRVRLAEGSIECTVTSVESSNEV
jgi:exodeoxyribonuclease VII large subunit